MPKILDDDAYIVVPSGMGADPYTDRPWYDDNNFAPGLFDLSTDARGDAFDTGATKPKGQHYIAGEGLSPDKLKDTDVSPNNAWYDYAKQQIGIDYVFGSWNAAGQEDGGGAEFDCSGFTGAVLEAGGYKSIPHSAYRQSLMFPRLKKNELKPGDLIFYNYGRLGPGIADHVAIYLGNGRQIAASSSADKVTIQPVDWSHFQNGGDTKLSKGGAFDPGARARANIKPGQLKQRPQYADVTLTPASMGSNPDLATVTANMYTSMYRDAARSDKRTPSFKDTGGMSGQIKEQLYRGFMDAGRPDLAKMVGTKDFDTWIKAESGWDPNRVSQHFAGHGRNAGLFQFALLDRQWVWDDVNRQDWSYSATPYQQARAVVQNFNLTAADIRRYADEIRSGTYQGWG